MPAETTPGAVAYAAYWGFGPDTAWPFFRDWTKLGPHEQQRWEAAAQAVRARQEEQGDHECA